MPSGGKPNVSASKPFFSWFILIIAHQKTMQFIKQNYERSPKNVAATMAFLKSSVCF
jgi:hypothetical protein